MDAIRYKTRKIIRSEMATHLQVTSLNQVIPEWVYYRSRPNEKGMRCTSQKMETTPKSENPDQPRQPAEVKGVPPNWRQGCPSAHIGSLINYDPTAI